MTKVKFEGTPINLLGSFPKAGEQAPNFCLTGVSLSDIVLEELKGKKIILNIFPSVDTPICALSVKDLDKAVKDRDDVIAVCVSADLPFAFHRFAQMHQIENVVSGSTFRSPDFLESYGVEIAEGALSGLAARALVVIDENGIVIHSELSEEITFQANIEKAISSL